MSLVLFALSSLDSIVQFYTLYFLFGAMGSALLFSPLYANVGFWFKENPGLALGLALALALGPCSRPCSRPLALGTCSSYLLLGSALALFF